jgi:Nuclease-related domain/Viral (Superfamily 1) RNA helicase
VFNGLKRLEDDWIVVHGLRFIAPANGRFPPRNGEADFVLVHPRQGLIVLEVKGGRYEIDHGRWFTFPGGQRTPMDQSPFAQATRNRYDLADHICHQTGIRGLPFGHAVVFTDGEPNGNLGPDAPRSIVVNGREIADLPPVVKRICAHWFTPGTRGLSQKQFDQVMSVLAPTAAVVADQRYFVDVTMVDVRQLTEHQVQFTNEQLAVIQATTPGVFVAVLGAAGTGKTIIATRRAAQLAHDGLKVLFMADQRYLHGALMTRPSLRHPNIILGTPEEVIAKIRPAADPAEKALPLWERFMEAAEEGVTVDAVIVDEAQNCDDDLLEAIQSLRPGSCHLYADPYQRDSSGMWLPPGSPRTFWLTRNCRNSLPIAKLVARIGGSLTPHEGAAGRPVRFIEAERDREAFEAQFAAVVTDQLRTLDPTEIAILTCATDTAALRKVLTAHHVRISRRPGDTGVTLLSASEFRGCEAPVVLLIAGPSHACPAATATTNHYVAVSRAVAELTVIGNAEDWDSYRFMMETP